MLEPGDALDRGGARNLAISGEDIFETSPVFLDSLLTVRSNLMKPTRIQRHCASMEARISLARPLLAAWYSVLW